MISVIKTDSEFDALKERWDELVEQSSTATPYQTFLFNKISWSVWHEPQDKLYIICFSQSEGAKPEAIIPCFINAKKELHLIDFLSDFCGGIIPDDSIEKYAMYKEIANYIQSDSEIERVCFNNLRQDSRLLAYLYAFGEYSSVKVLTGYTIVRMTPSAENQDFVDSIQNCNSSQRRKLRKRLNAISGLTFDRFISPTTYPDNDIQEIAKHMIAKMMRSPEYFTERFFSYFHKLYDAGLIQIVSHKKEGSPIAEKFFLVNEKQAEYISWITLYKNKQDNSNLLLASLDMMYNAGFYNLNFARGVYAYKLSDFHPNIYTLNQLIIHKSRQAELKYNLSLALKEKKNYIKQRAYIALANVKHKLFPRK